MDGCFIASMRLQDSADAVNLYLLSVVVVRGIQYVCESTLTIFRSVTNGRPMCAIGISDGIAPFPAIRRVTYHHPFGTLKYVHGVIIHPLTCHAMMGYFDISSRYFLSMGQNASQVPE